MADLDAALLQSSQLFFQRRYAQGLQLTASCLSQRPSCPALLIQKALYQYQLGHAQTAVGDLNTALGIDPLNYQVYFNLAAVQLREKQEQQAFKNLCCCLSVLHLLKARREKSEAEVEKAVEYSFNNKEARLLKSLMRLEAGKKIEALNQINYALYLDPSHPDLKRVQHRIYREMGMKELRAENKLFQKPRFDRLETNKEVPTDPAVLKTHIEKMFQDINRLVKTLPVDDVYRVKAEDMESQANSHSHSVVYHQKHIIRRLENSSFLKSVVGACETDRIKIAFAKERDEHSTAHNTLNTVVNSGGDKTESSGEPASEQYLILDSSGSRLGDISISNISQNSRIKLNKVSRISNQILDVSECFKSFLQDSLQQPSHESSIDSSENTQNLELKLPLQTIQGLKQNEKIILAVQKVRVNEQGVKEEVQELYEIVGNSNGFQLVKCTHQK